MTALELACVADFWVSTTETPRVVERESFRLVVGPQADEDLIATLSCRRMVEFQNGGRADEPAVRKLVREHGFQYVGPALAPKKTAPRSRARKLHRSA